MMQEIYKLLYQANRTSSSVLYLSAGANIMEGVSLARTARTLTTLTSPLTLTLPNYIFLETQVGL